MYIPNRSGTGMGATSIDNDATGIPSNRINSVAVQRVSGAMQSNAFDALRMTRVDTGVPVSLRSVGLRQWIAAQKSVAAQRGGT